MSNGLTENEGEIVYCLICLSGIYAYCKYDLFFDIMSCSPGHVEDNVCIYNIVFYLIIYR